MKKSIFSLAALMMLAITGLTSCGNIDDSVYPERQPVIEPISFIDYTQQDNYPYYRMGAPEGSSYDVIDHALVIKNDVEQANNWDLQPFILDFISVKEGLDYTVRITYKSTVEGAAWLNFGTWSGNMPCYYLPLEKTDVYKTVEHKFEKATFAAEGNAHILFQMGKLIGTVTIQKVEVFEQEPAQ